MAYNEPGWRRLLGKAFTALVLVAALALGFGIGRATGSDHTKHPPVVPPTSTTTVVPHTTTTAPSTPPTTGQLPHTL